KPVEQVLQEVQAWADRGATYLFFADDNFVGHRAYAKELLRALIRWNGKRAKPLSFHTQASIDMVRDDDLLGLLRDANFYSVFVGVESPRKASLAETHKTQNELHDGHDALYRRLYAPDAYAERVLGALERFRDVTYVPEPFMLKRLLSGLRILSYYIRHGKPARRFFFRLLARTARVSPRSLKVVMMKLGMYLHFCELHARKTGWDPWAEPAGPPAPKKRLPVQASG